MSDLDHTLVGLSRMIEDLRAMARTSGFVQATAVSVQAAAGGEPRTMTAHIEERGDVPGIGMATHQTNPAVGDGVWLVKVGPSRYLLWGVVG